MPRYREKYTLIPRKTKSGTIVYHIRYYPPGSDKRVTVSTGWPIRDYLDASSRARPTKT